jgi:hypothetical protein
VDLNNLEGISSLINSMAGGAKIGGLGDMSKLTGLLGTRGLGLGLGKKFPILLILLLLVLFGNRGGYGNQHQQYACCCYKKKHRKHHRRSCCYGNYGNYGNQSCGCGGYSYGGNSGYGGFGGGSNIIFIIILLFLVQVGKRAYPLADNATGNIFNFNAAGVSDTDDDNYDYKDTDEEE